MCNYEVKNLIIVYKEELLLNQLKKLIETDDDNEESVGTRDNSIKIISWDEKKWTKNKKEGNIIDKVLFLGPIKGTKKKLIPTIDIKFDKYGVKYGWAGNQFVLWLDQSVLKDEEKYDEFLKDIATMPIPEKYKNEIAKPDPLTNTNYTGDSLQNLFSDLLTFFVNEERNLFSKFNDKKHREMQMYFYGIINLYLNHLQKFMDA